MDAGAVGPVGPDDDDHVAVANDGEATPPVEEAANLEVPKPTVEDAALMEEIAASEKRGSVMARRPTSFSLRRRRT